MFLNPVCTKPGRSPAVKECIRVAGLLLACSMFGCEQGPPSLADYTDTNIKKVRTAYGVFMSAHGFRGPENEEEFKEYLTKNKNALVKLSRMGIAEDEILDIFVSERDGKPFKIRYDIVGLGNHPIVFEAEGVDGKRMVAYTPPQELGPAEYDEAWGRKTSHKSGLESMPTFGEGPQR